MNVTDSLGSFGTSDGGSSWSEFGKKALDTAGDAYSAYQKGKVGKAPRRGGRTPYAGAAGDDTTVNVGGLAIPDYPQGMEPGRGLPLGVPATGDPFRAAGIAGMDLSEDEKTALVGLAIVVGVAALARVAG